MVKTYVPSQITKYYQLATRYIVKTVLMAMEVYVLIGIKGNYAFESLIINTNCEICAVRVSISSSHTDSLILISFYRPPNRDTAYHLSLCNAISDIVTAHPRSVIYCTDDLNLPDLCWSSESVTGHTYPSEMNIGTLNLVNDCGFTQAVDFPYSRSTFTRHLTH